MTLQNEAKVDDNSLSSRTGSMVVVTDDTCCSSKHSPNLSATKKSHHSSIIQIDSSPQPCTSDISKRMEKKKNQQSLAIMITLTFLIFIAEVVVGYMGNAMALIADSFHMLSDVAALGVAYACLKISEKLSKDNTFGWARAEVLGALINAVFLMALCFTILIEAVVRFTHAEPMNQPFHVFVCGIVGLLVNLLGIFLFSGAHSHAHGGSHGHSHGGSNDGHSHSSHKQNSAHTHGHSHEETGLQLLESSPESDSIDLDDTNQIEDSSQLNMKGVFLHVVSDALGSAIVIVTSGIITFTDAPDFFVYYLDPVLSIVLVGIMSYATIPFLFKSAKILLQSIPHSVDMTEIKNQLMEVEGVGEIHDFHVWQLAGDRIIASAHIKFDSSEAYTKSSSLITKIFHQNKIHATSIQPEFPEMVNNSQHNCSYSCQSNNCQRKNVHCCPLDKRIGGSTKVEKLMSTSSKNLFSIKVCKDTHCSLGKRKRKGS